MNKRKLASSGLEVSAIGFGCMGLSFGYGPPLERQKAITLVRDAFECGVTFFDTAEALRSLRQRRATGRGASADSRQGRDCHQVRLRRRQLAGGMDKPPGAYSTGWPTPRSGGSTRTESNLFYQHRVDPKVPMEDVAGAVKELIGEGKVKHFGLSEPACSRFAVRTRCSRWRAVQSEYSLWWREPEKEVLPTCQELGIGFVPSAR